MAQKVKNMSSAALAFLGDSVFEVNVRNRIVCTCEANAKELNARSKALTNAKAQSVMARALLDVMTDEEMAVYKRGRNLKSINAPKTCSISEYRMATGLEALFGFLFLEERHERLQELLDIALETNNEENE